MDSVCVWGGHISKLAGTCSLAKHVGFASHMSYLNTIALPRHRLSYPICWGVWAACGLSARSILHPAVYQKTRFLAAENLLGGMA